jgi:hypothetical protein
MKKVFLKIKICIVGPQRMCVAENKILLINQINVTLAITRKKKLIWYGHFENMNPTRLPKIIIHWKPEGGKKRGGPRRT